MPQPQPSLSTSQLAALDLLIAHMQENNQTQVSPMGFIDGIVHSVTHAVSSVTHAATTAATNVGHAVTNAVTGAVQGANQAAQSANNSATSAAQGAATAAPQVAQAARGMMQTAMGGNRGTIMTSAIGAAGEAASVGEARVSDPRLAATLQALADNQSSFAGISLDQLIALRNSLAR